MGTRARPATRSISKTPLTPPSRWLVSASRELDRKTRCRRRCGSWRGSTSPPHSGCWLSIQCADGAELRYACSADSKAAMVVSRLLPRVLELRDLILQRLELTTEPI